MFIVENVNFQQITFSDKLSNEKPKVLLETKSIKKALMFAYHVYNNAAPDLVIGNCFRIKDDDKIICTFGYSTTKRSD